jgi:hypothetical protein
MNTQIGVGSSTQTDSKAAGVEAAAMALTKGNIEHPHFALLFCGGKHNPHEFIEGVRSVLGDTPSVGGSGLGIITNDFLGYSGYEAGVTVFSSSTLGFQVFAQNGLDKDERAAGDALGQQISDTGMEDGALLVFYDSSKQQAPPMLNFATWLFEGLEPHLPSGITCAGGGLLSDMQLSTTYQFYNNEVRTQNAVAVLITGKCKMHTTIMHGCRPSGSYHTITKAQGPVVSEIDGRPALEVIDELMGSNHNIPWKDFALFVTLGLNRGDKFSPFNEKDYANRLTLAVDEESKSLIMFEPDLKAGDEFQLMRRSVDLAYIQSGIDELRTQMNGTKPFFSFYINCAGRAKPYSGGAFEDAEEVQKALGTELPLMGFYSGVEVASINGRLQPLDWTGVLCMLNE